MCPNSLCACNAFYFLIRQHPVRVDREKDLIKTLMRQQLFSCCYQSESHVCRFGHSGTEPGQPKSNRSFLAQKCYSFVNLNGHVLFFLQKPCIANGKTCWEQSGHDACKKLACIDNFFKCAIENHPTPLPSLSPIQVST